MDASITSNDPGLLRLVEAASTLAAPARVRILLALEAAEELSAAEVARAVGLGRTNASNHLARLLAAGVVAERRVGRHRFLRLAKPEILAAVRSVAGVEGPPPRLPKPRFRGASGLPVADRVARTCYDHLAGRLGVALTDHLLKRRWIAWRDAEHGEMALTVAGTRALRDLGVIGELRATHRARIRPCLDRTERRPHVAGAVGATLAGLAFDRRWLLRTPRSRALEITPAGQRGFVEVFGLDLDDAGLRGRAAPSV